MFCHFLCPNEHAIGSTYMEVFFHYISFITLAVEAFWMLNDEIPHHRAYLAPNHFRGYLQQTYIAKQIAELKLNAIHRSLAWFDFYIHMQRACTDLSCYLLSGLRIFLFILTQEWNYPLLRFMAASQPLSLSLSFTSLNVYRHVRCVYSYFLYLPVSVTPNTCMHVVD